ncbi:MAG: DUF86 domain-containing protein [Patescibacteria group bacterium]|nr:DUF86 domain-containing protein [Patescibacteria group bacterium]MCL5431613.1 DUF86 domain-containing protein [Patescibacteria group bacterium]
MPVDRTLIQKKLDFLDQQLSGVENLEPDEASFVEKADIHDLVTFRLQQSVETCIDIATHIIAESGLPRRETAKDAFLLLGEQGVINKDLSLRMGKAADFRNRVVHGYNNFDYALLFNDYKDNVKDLRQFGAEILKFLGQI